MMAMHDPKIMRLIPERSMLCVKLQTWTDLTQKRCIALLAKKQKIVHIRKSCMGHLSVFGSEIFSRTQKAAFRVLFSIPFISFFEKVHP